MLTANKGEWSEIYTFFKLLSEKRLYSGDANVNKIPNLFYPILKILREESRGEFEYSFEDNVVVVIGNNEEIRVPSQDFAEKTNELYREIRTNTGTFALPEIEKFMESVHCYSIKAKSTDKTDIKIIVHDLRTGMQPTLGFSIKSEVGAASTILNASIDNTNFLYRLNGITTFEADSINQIEEFTGKFNKMSEIGVNVEFINIVRDRFRNNLMYVDYCLPDILARMLVIFYSSPTNKLTDITAQIRSENILNFDLSDNQDFYEHKVKRFLTDITLGMKPASVWRGEYEATGGYLIVKEDGDVVCYHIYNRNQFENYLFHNTKFDTPSTTRHLFGNIYQENGEFFIKLNLQIRFI
jgi:HpaII restriction endonuclease